MNETVSVDEALKKGRRMIILPSFMIFLIFLFGSFYLFAGLKMSPWFVLVGFVGGFIGAWLYWSIIITKWRIWAFENVRNVHELKKRAIKELLIWPDGNILEKTEIRVGDDKQKWQDLQSKFLKEDEFVEDFSIPDETRIYYSKTKAYVQAGMFALILIVGIYFLNMDKMVLGLIFIAMGAFFIIKNLRLAANREPQIIISNKGIQTVSNEFMSWNVITGEDIVREGYGKNTRYYFVFDHPVGKVKMQFEELDINKNDLFKLLTLYRGRFNKSQKG